MLLLSLFREVTTICYGFTGKERRLSTKVRVPEKKNKYNAIRVVCYDVMPQSDLQNLI